MENIHDNDIGYNKEKERILDFKLEYLFSQELHKINSTIIQEELVMKNKEKMTPEAQEILENLVKKYELDLIQVSNSKASNDERILIRHIKEGKEEMNQKKYKNNLIRVFGGFLIGATFSNIINIILRGGELHPYGILISFFLAVIGGIMFAYKK